MGNFLHQLRRLIWPPPARVLLVGLAAGGKTTILYRLKSSETVHRDTIPMVVFGVETMEHRNLSFTVWELGGQEKIHPLRRHYYPNASALVLVVDSSDRERIGGRVDSMGRLDEKEERGTARQELHQMLLEDDLCDIPLLVFANKQDLPHAMSCEEITQRLGLQAIRGRRWFVQGSSALTSDGLSEGVDWLADAIKYAQTNRDRFHP